MSNPDRNKSHKCDFCGNVLPSDFISSECHIGTNKGDFTIKSSYCSKPCQVAYTICEHFIMMPPEDALNHLLIEHRFTQEKLDLGLELVNQMSKSEIKRFHSKWCKKNHVGFL